MDTVIHADQLTCRFGDTVAVDRLSLRVSAGEIFGLLGHNGAGKTTTVRLLNGILAPHGGTISVLGMNPSDDGQRIRLRTGVLTETPSLDERLTAVDSLELFAHLYSVPSRDIPQRIDELLDTFGLSDRRHDRVGTFSSGMKQRLALARALFHRPDILFLDEPATGLDPVATRHLHELIIELSWSEGRTVVLCTHNLAEAQKLCSRVAVLQRGRILASGTPQELAHQSTRGQHLLIETDSEHLRDALRIVASLPGLGEIRHDTDHLTITGIGRDMVPEVAKELVGAGIPVFQIRMQRPSLEDIYFALHDADLHDADSPDAEETRS